VSRNVPTAKTTTAAAPALRESNTEKRQRHSKNSESFVHI
jgi:hypothetical protein